MILLILIPFALLQCPLLNNQPPKATMFEICASEQYFACCDASLFGSITAIIQSYQTRLGDGNYSDINNDLSGSCFRNIKILLCASLCGLAQTVDTVVIPSTYSDIAKTVIFAVDQDFLTGTLMSCRLHCDRVSNTTPFASSDLADFAASLNSTISIGAADGVSEYVYVLRFVASEYAAILYGMPPLAPCAFDTTGCSSSASIHSVCTDAALPPSSSVAATMPNVTALSASSSALPQAQAAGVAVGVVFGTVCVVLVTLSTCIAYKRRKQYAEIRRLRALEENARNDLSCECGVVGADDTESGGGSSSSSDDVVNAIALPQSDRQRRAERRRQRERELQERALAMQAVKPRDMNAVPCAQCGTHGTPVRVNERPFALVCAQCLRPLQVQQRLLWHCLKSVRTQGDCLVCGRTGRVYAEYCRRCHLPLVAMFREDDQHSATSGHDDACSVCLDALVGDVMRLPCPARHRFHLLCFTQWFVQAPRRHARCPLCAVRLKMPTAATGSASSSDMDTAIE
jgi:hypothetical protein